jgi:hypothetical protein
MGQHLEARKIEFEDFQGLHSRNVDDFEELFSRGPEAALEFDELGARELLEEILEPLRRRHVDSKLFRRGGHRGPSGTCFGCYKDFSRHYRCRIAPD